MQVLLNHVSVRGISTALPENQLEIGSLKQKFGALEVERIMASTGIQSVRVVTPKQKISDLSVAAAESLFKALDILPSSVDGIILVTQTPDAQMPATSSLIQDRLGLPVHAVAFDINYGCSGYVYGLFQASLLVSSGACQRVLVCAGDTISRFLNPEDHTVRLVFGDASSATLIEKGEDDIAFNIFTDGSGSKNLHIGLEENPYLHMNGQAIMEFALKRVPECITELLAFKNWKKEEVGSFVLHQANQFMLNYLRRKMLVDAKAVPVSVKDTGNTGPASIPLTLSLLGENLKQENRLEKSVLCGFGVGLSWGAATVDLSKTRFIQPVSVA